MSSTPLHALLLLLLTRFFRLSSPLPSSVGCSLLFFLVKIKQYLLRATLLAGFDQLQANGGT
jgi:hypothetical protein